MRIGNKGLVALGLLVAITLLGLPVLESILNQPSETVTGNGIQEAPGRTYVAFAGNIVYFDTKESLKPLKIPSRDFPQLTDKGLYVVVVYPEGTNTLLRWDTNSGRLFFEGETQWDGGDKYWKGRVFVLDMPPAIPAVIQVVPLGGGQP